jgi:quercetin dioxygenase-like cupin family protein/quinol monooxygenase YgiN
MSMEQSMTNQHSSVAARILRPDELPAIDRGNGARTTPLVTTPVGATSFLNGITTFEPGAAIGHHTHNCVESVMIIEGDAIVEIDGEETRLRVHDTTFVPANVPHRFRNASDSARMRILWMYASTDATRTLTASGETGRIDAEQRAASSERIEPVVEVCEVDVLPGHEAAFEAAVAEAAVHFQRAEGARTLELFSSHEQPSRYRLLIGWDSIAHHEAFRGTEGFTQWRALAGPHFDGPPRVEHVRSVVKRF